MRFTQSLLTKLEALLGAAGYTVRYEKGNFRGGSCVVEDRKLVMVNKFSPLESRISTLIEVALSLAIPPAGLEEPERKLLAQLEAYRAAQSPTLEEAGL